MRQSAEQRFWSKVDRSGECWLWVGARDRRKGRSTGFFSAFGECITTRVSWVLANGPIPDGSHVLIECGTPYCVRPEHLKLGRREYERPNEGDGFWSRVDKSGDCWLWTGDRNNQRGGYGRVSYRDHNVQAHRQAWILTNGPIAEGLQVCHRCDNPPCVNPEHLFLGTASDNLQDASRKKRIGGEQNGQAKLTLEQVRWVRENPDGLNMSERGRRLGVTPQCIHRILNGKTWRNFK